MDIYIVRHGQAASMSSSDSLRPLTDRGRNEVRDLWAALSNEISLSRIVASPYLRAQQTAEIIRDCQLDGSDGRSLRVETCELITPEGQVAPALDWLVQNASEGSVAIVSHMPMVSLLTAALLGDASRRSFAAGAVVKLSCELPAAGLSEFIWMAEPNNRR